MTPIHDPDRLEWEEKVYADIAEMLDVPRSNAQRIVKAQAPLLESAWQQGLSARATAIAIASKNIPNPGDKS